MRILYLCFTVRPSEKYWLESKLTIRRCFDVLWGWSISILNRFRTGQDQCTASLHKWWIASSETMLMYLTLPADQPCWWRSATTTCAWFYRPPVTHYYMTSFSAVGLTQIIYNSAGEYSKFECYRKSTLAKQFVPYNKNVGISINFGHNSLWQSNEI